MKLIKIFFVFIASLILMNSCVPEQEVTQKENAIIIQNYAFNPSIITVSKGTSITWMNEDSAPHAIKSGIFESETLNKGDLFTYTFNEMGTFEYICSIHTSMKGTVIVQ